MFTGIIETLGVVKGKEEQGTNVELTFEASLARELKVDQSLAHNGVCLTVTEIISDSQYKVTAIQETLKRTNLGELKVGDIVNLERCTPVNGRLDGHIVQGHVDTIAICKDIFEHDGSWEFFFEYEKENKNLTVEKGSITINGVSLTVVNSEDHTFSVAIIPYTFEHTNFKTFSKGSTVNIEFDIVGKYIQKLGKAYLTEN